jgi:5-formyltetrahydrofolate cyclo-ligase
VYLPMGSEINIKPFIQHLLNQNIKVVSPKTLKNRELQHLELSSLEELENGIFGTMHPTNSTEYKGNYDLVIVPGLAFDSGNYRLGYGGGYYDKFLEQHPAAFKIGICYPFQKMASVPKEAHDVCLDKVLAKPF